MLYLQNETNYKLSETIPKIVVVSSHMLNADKKHFIGCDSTVQCIVTCLNGLLS